MHCFRFSPIPDATRAPPSSMDYQFKCSNKGDPFSFNVTRYVYVMGHVCIHDVCNEPLRIGDVYKLCVPNDPLLDIKSYNGL